MTRLPEIQRNFSDFVWGRQKTAAPGILGKGFNAEQRLAIYRNNTLLGLTEALRAVYPVIDRLVGESCFNALCRRYIHRHPPQTACLLTFGGRFPEFLAECPIVAGLPYLSDTARLEWFRHESYYESDEPGMGLAGIAEISRACNIEIRFHLHPAVRFLISGFPVLRIWRFNQADYNGDAWIDLDEGGCRLLVSRSGWDVDVTPVGWSEYRFLTGLRSGLTLNEAVADILEQYPEFDVAAMLQLCLNKSIFLDYSLV